MQPYPPNKSALATSFKVGDPVKWYISQNQISPYVGKVTEICPGINKIWAEMPVGGNQQFDPSELILVPPEQGIPLPSRNTGYSSYDKEISHRDYGTIENPTVIDMAKTLAAKQANVSPGELQIKKMASDVAMKFASEVVEKLASDILECKKSGMKDVQAYQKVYETYGSKCSDSFLRHSISTIYGL